MKDKREIKVRDFLGQYESMAGIFKSGKTGSSCPSDDDYTGDTNRRMPFLEHILFLTEFYIQSKLDEDSTEEDVMKISEHMMDMEFMEFCDEVNRDINLEVALNPDKK